MKKNALLLCYIFLCSSLTWGQSFNLNVTNGYGGGTYFEGDTVYIWSIPEYQNFSFDGWQGSATNYMLEQNEWLTRIFIPQNSNIGAINADASFTDLTSSVNIGMQIITLPGINNGIQNTSPIDIYYQIPNNPIGIIFCFHGTGGSGASFENDFEKRSFFKAGAKRNYIMIATDANEKTNGDQDGNGKLRWEINDPLNDDEINNIDIKLIKALKDSIINRYNLPLDFPAFAMGVSNGANFADLCAAALQFNASAHMTGNGHYDIYANRVDATPVIFVQSENDQHPSADPIIAINNHSTLINRGISSEFYWHRKTPVYSKRFIRTIDLLITPVISDSIFQRMVNTPMLLDSDNKLLIQNNLDLPTNLFTGLGLSSGSITNCESQIKIMNADHKFHSHYNNRIIDFYDLHLNNTTSISDYEKNIFALVFPNPSNDIFNIQFDSSYNTNISVTNIVGNIIYHEKSDDIKKTIDLSQYAKGIYNLSITTTHSVNNYMLILQ